MQNLTEVNNRIQMCAAYSEAYLELSLWHDACTQMFGSEIQHFVLSPPQSLFSWTACARRAPPVRSSFSLFLPPVKNELVASLWHDDDKRPPESRSYLRWQRSLTPPCSSWGEMSTLPGSSAETLHHKWPLTFPKNPNSRERRVTRADRGKTKPPHLYSSPSYCPLSH